MSILRVKKYVFENKTKFYRNLVKKSNFPRNEQYWSVDRGSSFLFSLIDLILNRILIKNLKLTEPIQCKATQIGFSHWNHNGNKYDYQHNRHDTCCALLLLSTYWAVLFSSNGKGLPLMHMLLSRNQTIPFCSLHWTSLVC